MAGAGELCAPFLPLRSSSRVVRHCHEAFLHPCSSAGPREESVNLKAVIEEERGHKYKPFGPRESKACMVL